MDEPRAAGEVLRAQAIRDAKALGGRGAIKRANAQRIEWGAEPTKRAHRFPAASAAADPGVNALASFVLAAGLDVPAWCARTARYASWPIADFMAFAESVKARRSQKRLPGWLSAARGRMLKDSTDLDDSTIERLEALRCDDPRSALKATKDALKTAAGPVTVGRLLAIHASNLREVYELGDALLSLRVALPALDVAGDARGVGRVLSAAAAVVRDCGEFTVARGLVDEAEACHVKAGWMTGRGAAMIFRGSLTLRTGGDPRAALRELDAALALIPGSVCWRVAGLHQIRAAALIGCSDRAGAREAIGRASVAAPDSARVLRGRIAWHAADIESDAGDHDAAEALYVRAFDLVNEPLCDRLLVAAQAVRAAARQGETARAVRMARAMLGPMFGPLEEKEEPTRRALRAAHRDLYAASLDAGLSAAIVDRAIGRIEGARATRCKRLRRPF